MEQNGVGGGEMIGRYPAKLDEKNRLFVPAKLRPELGDDFYTRSRGDKRREVRYEKCEI